jgi:hypothetical protein
MEERRRAWLRTVVTRQQASKLFDALLASEDRALLLLTQVLARLAEATNG